MCKSKEAEQTLPCINSPNAAAATVIGSNDWLTFEAGGSNVTTCDAAAASMVPIHTSSMGSLVINRGISTTIRSISGLTSSMPITIQQGALLNYDGQTYGEGSYRLEVDGTMHLSGDSAASAAVASPADLD